jgi:hypothetical protein
VAVTLVTVSCGGQVDGQDDGGTGQAGDGSSSSSGGGGGGSSGLNFIPCPSSPPIVGSYCGRTPGHGCAYIDASTGSCQAFICGSSPYQVWASTTEGC